MSTEMTDQERQAAISSKSAKMAEYERERDRYQSKHDSNSDKIERLRAARKALKDIKDRIEDRAKAQKGVSGDEYTYYEWYGEKCAEERELYSKTIPEEYTYYISRVDGVLDDIYDEETRLENENLELWGLIGKLGSWINSLGNEIAKLLN